MAARVISTPDIPMVHRDGKLVNALELAREFLPGGEFYWNITEAYSEHAMEYWCNRIPEFQKYYDMVKAEFDAAEALRIKKEQIRKWNENKKIGRKFAGTRRR